MAAYWPIERIAYSLCWRTTSKSQRIYSELLKNIVAFLDVAFETIFLFAFRRSRLHALLAMSAPLLAHIEKKHRKGKVFLQWVNIMAVKSPLMSWNCVRVVKWMRKTEEKWCHPCWFRAQPQNQRECNWPFVHLPNWCCNDGNANTMYGFFLQLAGKLQWDTHWSFLWFVIKEKCVKGTNQRSPAIEIKTQTH